jgi:hypothetical protein
MVWVVKFTPSQGLQYPYNSMLDLSQIQSGCGGEKKNPCPDGNQTLVVQSIASHFTDWAIPTYYDPTVTTEKQKENS